MGTKLKALGHRIILEPEFPEDKTSWGFDMSVTETAKYEKAATETGRVLAIGPNAFKAFDDGEPWVEIGELVIFAKHAGKFVKDPKDPDKVYVVINDEDLQVGFEETEDE